MSEAERILHLATLLLRGHMIDDLEEVIKQAELSCPRPFPKDDHGRKLELVHKFRNLLEQPEGRDRSLKAEVLLRGLSGSDRDKDYCFCGSKLPPAAGFIRLHACSCGRLFRPAQIGDDNYVWRLEESPGR